MTRTTPALIKLVIFAVVTLLATALLAQTLGAFPPDGVTYRARFTDVTGLLPGDDVRIAGVRVGKVSDIAVVDDSLAEVAFTVDRDVPLATSARAAIRYRNLVGQRYLALSEGPGDGRPLRADGLIPLTQTKPALDLTVLFNGFRPLFTALNPDDVNKLAYEIIQVLQGEGGTVASLLRRTASLTNTLADRDAVIGRVVSNLNSVLETLAAHDRELDESVTQLQQFVSGLSADRAAIGEALVNLADLTDTTAGLLRQTRPPLAADVRALDDLAGTLDRNAGVIDATLGRLPQRYESLTRVASYGSWFNFYLCDFDGRVAVAGHAPLTTPTVSATAARCATGGSQ
ncbi:phospholipid/cholesterol/gamma-HCH transport system substrate-binding protein [Micromonospora viridifaciens]|uniref:Phospholipid/cholesterol/gamma-HCH transport system substrate-binding protein n=1 Tax=Micromonospora viridifaciens TaxID=1881 RepID=A0A1C4XZX3_MICVI|nr:MCE family protein [Micromonospora viridifaciens]SCF14023.1 phospholipid/cholesterol/gamma-HCH transport system substrate-binding protein [Micromonospora viridifaciens]